MKKKILIVIIALMLVLTLLLSLGCVSDLDNFGVPFGDYSNLDTAEGLSAFDVMHQALQSWQTGTDYAYTESFQFQAAIMGGLEVATQQAYNQVRSDGDKLFRKIVTVGTGAGQANDCEKFYFDGKKGQILKVTNNQKRVPGLQGADKTAPAIFNADLSGLSYQPYTDDLDLMFEPIKRHMTTYVLSSRENLSSSHDDTVYTKNDRYYFTITIKCLEESYGGVQAAAEKEILEKTGAKQGTLQWQQDSKIHFEVMKQGDTFRFAAWKREEHYSGEAESFPARVECKQSATLYFSYQESDYKITSDII